MEATDRAGGAKGYDIFPRTFTARALLVLAFVAGLGLMLWWVPLMIFADEGLSGLFEQQPPCSTDDEREACRDAQTELLPDSQPACAGAGRRVCLVPLGQVDAELVRGLVEYYREEYELEIGILTPSEAPWQFISPDRDQMEGESLAAYMETLFPEDFADPEVALIGLTPIDMYYWEKLNWRFALGFADWSEEPRAVVSTYRMHLGFLGLVDDERVEERARKMVTKYLGLLYYGLPLEDDPTSPMYNSILSVGDLDRMEEPLPVAR